MSWMELFLFLVVLLIIIWKVKDDVCLVKNFGVFEMGVMVWNYFLVKFMEIF